MRTGGHFQDPYGRSAKTMQYMCVFAKEHCRLDGALMYENNLLQIYLKYNHVAVLNVCLDWTDLFVLLLNPGGSREGS